jgi:plasmid stabilization system protein ParE
MGRYVLTAAARADLAEIAAFIREDNPDAARRVVQSLQGAMGKLAERPGMGHVREDLAQSPLRFWSVYSYLIIYRPESHPLQILRVLHAARDVRAILEDE